jgi:hypothetical protein
MVIAYYHRNGYWLDMLRGWSGEARVASGPGSDRLQRATGHRDDPAPYAEVAGRMAFARWGGGMGVSY